MTDDLEAYLSEPRNLNDPMMLACSLSTWSGDKARCRLCDAPLPMRASRWCSYSCRMRAYREHWWNVASDAVKRDVAKCERCGASGRTETGRRVRLEAHHVEHARGRHSECSCIHHRANLECVCHDCHVAGHVEERRAARLEANAAAGYGEQLPFPLEFERPSAIVRTTGLS